MNNLQFDFKVDKTTNTVSVIKEFAADRSLVWDAFTKQEVLDKWWAPKPWKSETKYTDFKVGGRRFYAMVGPEGEKHWSIQDFTAINPMTNFKFFDAFTDENENVSSDMPSSEWDLNFSEQNGITKVSMTIKHKTLSDLEKILEMGFQEGFTTTLNYLEKLLADLS
ncbi:MAG TPA: SRPBCC domain-containing protein [Flavobacterium sp.]|nr:SRPBCC domain-containing protein [Flavobacterium sp.]